MNDPYMKGFNQGYVIAEHLPDLARDLAKAESSTPWMEGFRDGRMEYLIQEQIKEMSPSWLNSDWNRCHEPDQDKDHDRDDER